MKLNNNKKEQEQILDKVNELGFGYDSWNEIEELDNFIDDDQIIIEDDEGTLFLEIEDDEIVSVDYLPYGIRETFWNKGDE